MIRFECPHCGKGLRTDDGLAGEAFTCPGCKGRVRVPKAGKETVAPISSANNSKHFRVEPTRRMSRWNNLRDRRILFFGTCLSVVASTLALLSLRWNSDWLLWTTVGVIVVGVLFVLSLVIFCKPKPSCDECSRHKTTRKIGVVQRDWKSAKEALEAGDLASLGALSPEGDSIVVTIGECPHCGRKAPIDVLFATELNPMVAHVTYPGAALPAFERLCRSAVQS